MRSLRLPFLALGLLLPAAAAAQYGFVNSAIDAVGGSLPTFMPGGSICGGAAACGFVEIAEGIIVRYRPLLTVAGLLSIVIFGYRMIVGQEDDVIGKARTMMSATIAGLIMAWLTEPFILAFYGSRGEVPTSNIAGGAAVMSAEVTGVVNWVLVITAVLAILMMILTAAESIQKGTSDEGIGNIRKTIFSVLFGIILLLFRYILSDLFVETTHNPAPLFRAILIPISYAMALLGMVALIIVLYAGIQYVLSIGKEEQATKAKDLLIRAAIGVIVILVSLAVVNFVILPGVLE